MPPADCHMLPADCHSQATRMHWSIHDPGNGSAYFVSLIKLAHKTAQKAVVLLRQRQEQLLKSHSNMHRWFWLKALLCFHGRSSDHYTDCLLDALQSAASRAQSPGAQQQRDADRKQQQHSSQASHTAQREPQQGQLNGQQPSAQAHIQAQTNSSLHEGQSVSSQPDSGRQQASAQSHINRHNPSSTQGSISGSQSLHSQPLAHSLEDTPGPQEGATGTHARRQGAATEHGQGDGADVGHNFGGHAPRGAGSFNPQS